MSAAAGAAAQTVTIYGRVDAGITRQNAGTSTLAGGGLANTTELRHGSEPRLGFRGVEDLGGGLSAGFLMEHRFRVDNGLADPIFFKGRSFVYLESKDVGQLYVGRDYIPAFWPALRTDPWLWDTVGTPGIQHQMAGYRVENHVRASNTVGYRSRSFEGFSVNLAGGFGEGARPNERGANIEYSKGPLYLGAGFDRLNAGNKVALVGASYDFGLVRPSFLYVRSTVNNVDASNLTLAARMVLGQHILKAMHARWNPDGADNNVAKTGLGYEYSLSKRTALYTDVGSAKQQGSVTGKPRTRSTAYDLGLRHDF